MDVSSCIILYARIMENYGIVITTDQKVEELISCRLHLTIRASKRYNTFQSHIDGTQPPLAISVSYYSRSSLLPAHTRLLLLHFQSRFENEHV